MYRICFMRKKIWVGMVVALLALGGITQLAVAAESTLQEVCVKLNETAQGDPGYAALVVGYRKIIAGDLSEAVKHLSLVRKSGLRTKIETILVADLRKDTTEFWQFFAKNTNPRQHKTLVRLAIAIPQDKAAVLACAERLYSKAIATDRRFHVHSAQALVDLLQAEYSSFLLEKFKGFESLDAGGQEGFAFLVKHRPNEQLLPVYTSLLDSSSEAVVKYAVAALNGLASPETVKLVAARIKSMKWSPYTLRTLMETLLEIDTLESKTAYLDVFFHPYFILPITTTSRHGGGHKGAIIREDVIDNVNMLLQLTWDHEAALMPIMREYAQKLKKAPEYAVLIKLLGGFPGLESSQYLVYLIGEGLNDDIQIAAQMAFKYRKNRADLEALLEGIYSKKITEAGGADAIKRLAYKDRDATLLEMFKTETDPERWHVLAYIYVTSASPAQVAATLFDFSVEKREYIYANSVKYQYSAPFIQLIQARNPVEWQLLGIKAAKAMLPGSALEPMCQLYRTNNLEIWAAVLDALVEYDYTDAYQELVDVVGLIGVDLLPLTSEAINKLDDPGMSSVLVATFDKVGSESTRQRLADIMVQRSGTMAVELINSLAVSHGELKLRTIGRLVTEDDVAQLFERSFLFYKNRPRLRVMIGYYKYIELELLQKSLAPMLADANYSRRVLAIEILASRNDESVMPAIVTVIEDAPPFEKSMAAILSKGYGRKILPLIMPKLNSKNKKVRQSFKLVLDFQRGEIFPEIVTLAEHSDPAMRILLVSKIGQYAVEDHLDLLADYLQNDPSSRLKLVVLRMIQHSKNTTVVLATLKKSFQTEKESAVLRAIKAAIAKLEKS